MTSHSPIAGADELSVETPNRAVAGRATSRREAAAHGLAGLLAGPLRRLTSRLLRDVACGSIEVVLPDGERVTGRGSLPGPHAVIALLTRNPQCRP